MTLIEKEGKRVCGHLFDDYSKEKGDDAAVAPLLETEKGRILACYDALPVEKASLEISFAQVTVVEPSRKATVTLEVEERIKLLLAFKEKTKLPQLLGLSRGKWEARCKALDGNERDVPPADIGAPVPDGFTLVQSLRQGKKEDWSIVARKSIDALIEDLRDVTPLTSEALRKAKKDAFTDAYKKLVELVEAAEDKAIHAMPSEGPALTEALTKRFAPRADAALKWRSDLGHKCGSAYAATYKKMKDEGKDLLAPALKKKIHFGSCAKPKGETRVPNNNYPQYVFKRIEHGIAKATKITSWMKYEEPEST